MASTVSAPTTHGELSELPTMAFGTCKVGFGKCEFLRNASPTDVDEGEVEAAILGAVAAGYRFFDCAQFYMNEAAVGRALQKSGLPRSQYFLGSKVWPDNIYGGAEPVVAQLRRSIQDLQCGYLDVYLVHWPVPGESGKKPGKHVAAYKALEDFTRGVAGERGNGNEVLIQRLGVSNYRVADFEELTRSGLRVFPYCNQFEVSPDLCRERTIAYFHAKNVKIQAFRSLGSGRLVAGVAAEAQDRGAERQKRLQSGEQGSKNQNATERAGGESELSSGAGDGREEEGRVFSAVCDVLEELNRGGQSPRTAEDNAKSAAESNADRRITASQVLLRWALQRGFTVMPKSLSRVRQEENIAASDERCGWRLSDAQMARLNGLTTTTALARFQGQYEHCIVANTALEGSMKGKIAFTDIDLARTV